MRIRNLFTVPEGEKVTEKMFGRVLVSSVCSILFCMACLAGTTWAWFSASIQNTDNVIQIAEVTANVKVTANAAAEGGEGDTAAGSEGDPVVIAEGEGTEGAEGEGAGPVETGAVLTPDANGKYVLQPGSYEVVIKLDNNATARQCAVYVIMSVERQGAEPQYYSFVFENGKTEVLRELIVGEEATVGFTVSWVKAASAVEIGDAQVLTIGEFPAEETDAPADETSEDKTDEENDVTAEQGDKDSTQQPEGTETEGSGVDTPGGSDGNTQGGSGEGSTEEPGPSGETEETPETDTEIEQPDDNGGETEDAPATEDGGETVTDGETVNGDENTTDGEPVTGEDPNGTVGETTEPEGNTPLEETETPTDGSTGNTAAQTETEPTENS